MKKIFLFLFLVYSYSFSACDIQPFTSLGQLPENAVVVSNPGGTICDSTSPYFFYVGSGSTTYYNYTTYSQGSKSIMVKYYKYFNGVIPNLPSCPENNIEGDNGLYTCSNDGTQNNYNFLSNPDPLGGPTCRDLFEKDGQAYTCNPDTNEATLIPNSDGVIIDPEDGKDVPNCSDGYQWSSMGAGGTNTNATPTHTVYSCIPSSTNGTGAGDEGGSTNPNIGTVTNPDGSTTTTLPDGTTHTYYPSSQTTVTRYPDGTEETTYHDNSNGGTSGTGSTGGDSGSGSPTGGTSGTGTTGGTTGTDTGTGSSGGTTGTTDGGSTGGTSSSGGVGSTETTGGTSGTGSTGGTGGSTTTETPTEQPATNGNCNDSNLTLQEKMMCEINKSTSSSANKQAITNTLLGELNKNLNELPNDGGVEFKNSLDNSKTESDSAFNGFTNVLNDMKESYNTITEQINNTISIFEDGFTFNPITHIVNSENLERCLTISVFGGNDIFLDFITPLAIIKPISTLLIQIFMMLEVLRMCFRIIDYTRSVF